MELKQPLARRFVAVLYRWNSFARASPYPYNSFARRSAHAHLASRRIGRSYTVATFCRQNESLASKLSQAEHHNGELLGSNDRIEGRLEDTKDAAQHMTEHHHNASEDTNEAKQHTPTPYDHGSNEDSMLLDAEAASDDGSKRVHDLRVAKSLRQLMRQVPSSVVILTVASPDPTENIPVPLGTALSSFNTVSLDPPHVSFNIKHPSRTLDAIRAAGGLFRIHFLDDNRPSVAIVDAFSKGNSKEALEERHNLVGISFNLDNESPPPRLHTPRQVAFLECELTQELTVADHVVLIAKVKHVGNSRKLRPTLAYHNGTYKRNDGTPFFTGQGASGAVAETAKGKDRNAETLADEANDAKLFTWGYPFLYGESERRHFVASIQQHLEGDLSYVDMGVPQVLKILKNKLHIPKSSFGVDLEAIIQSYHKKHGRRFSRSKKPSEDDGFLYQYWGRLTPTQVTEIVNVTMRLVKKQPLILNVHPYKFFGLIGVHPYSFILAGDLLEPLRADKHLAQHVETTTEIRDDKFPTLSSWESVENAVKELFRTKDYQACLEMGNSEISHAIGINYPWVEAYVGRIRFRIFQELFPHTFSHYYMDIRGVVTPMETRVIISRVVEALSSSRPGQHTSYPWNFLAKLGVHPAICGFDVEYVLTRLLLLRDTTDSSADFRAAVNPLLEPLFLKGNVDWVELALRANELVEKHTMHVLHWSREDLIAAMGIDQKARIWSPFANKTPTRIKTSTLLPILFGKELRDRYGKGTPKENEAIAAYLKTNFNYSIEDKQQSVQASVGSQLENDGADEKSRQDMMENLGIEITPRAKATQELEEAMADFGIKIQLKPQSIRSPEGQEDEMQTSRIPSFRILKFKIGKGQENN
ncbi:hypothetical protein DM02DRAFT_551992 [Periconia macrospinosa]|uniref:Flavin reductase like domain-containing protein n=1 Tax=Periconia macrospinosa TaxID=97972 RepID=A0A2V1E942_9PLEO|nr:hypothetical protein DM02DRAFT_551992 [Periconia macrospinosa]